MKVFQILDGWCHRDCSFEFPDVGATVGKFHHSIIFVEAPDYVFEGWAYDETQEGDARFIRPDAPDGWLYDEATGTFYPETETAPSQQPTEMEQLRADVDYIAMEMGVDL